MVEAAFSSYTSDDNTGASAESDSARSNAPGANKSDSPPAVEGLMSWLHRARCQDEDPELFFPVGTTGPAVVQAEMAKAVCFKCPVSEECLEWSLKIGGDTGVWGGMDEVERRGLRRARRREQILKMGRVSFYDRPTY